MDMAAAAIKYYGPTPHASIQSYPSQTASAPNFIRLNYSFALPWKLFYEVIGFVILWALPQETFSGLKFYGP